MNKYSILDFFRSLLFYALLIMLPMSVFAESLLSDIKNEITPVFCVTPIKIRDGYYVGVAAGYDVYKIKDDIIYQDVNNIKMFNINPELAVNGMIGDFMLGYGKLLGKNSNLYFGIEFYANGSAADSDFQSNSTSIPIIIDTDVVVNGSFGLSIMPGFRINNISMIFLKLGYNWSTLSVDETVRTQNDFELNSIEYNDEATINGFLYGIGLESAFNDQFSLRAEYTHTTYGSFIAGSGANIKSSRNQFLMGLVYRFAS